MKRARIVCTAMLSLLVGVSTMAHAQGSRGRGEPAGRGRGQQPPPPVSQAEQQQRLKEQQQRAAQYKQHLDQQVRVVQQQTAQLDAKKRAAAVRAQQQYAAQLLQQQQHLQAARDYSRDPYITTPHTYRYTISGTARQTNQYGADVLRQAVNDGYQQGYAAGEADRQDHWKSNYQNSIAYRDANYGYEGNYVSQSDYNYYFRQGFRRGYTDGYNHQAQYGSVSNGSASILANVLTGILGLVSIH